jgi:hypothetical protein
MTIRLRFVHCHDSISDGIVFDTGGLYSHAECVTPDGKYLGAHADGGVQARPSDYDKGQFDRELFVDLPADDAMTAAFYAYAEKHIGQPYDFGAIFGFVLHLNDHDKGKVICSALMTLCLRACGWFATPLSLPAHQISPRDLLLVISGRQPI